MFIRMVLAAILALLPFAAASAERGTPLEAKAMVDRAIAYYEANGLDALVEQIHNTSSADFHDRDLYVFATAFDGTSVAVGANPKIVGRNILEIKDPNGTEFIKEMIDLVKNGGEGWVEYYFTDPNTESLAKKASWVKRLDHETLVGVGVYAD